MFMGEACHALYLLGGMDGGETGMLPLISSFMVCKYCIINIINK